MNEEKDECTKKNERTKVKVKTQNLFFHLLLKYFNIIKNAKRGKKGTGNFLIKVACPLFSFFLE
jgi:hypothetical protein